MKIIALSSFTSENKATVKNLSEWFARKLFSPGPFSPSIRLSVLVSEHRIVGIATKPIIKKSFNLVLSGNFDRKIFKTTISARIRLSLRTAIFGFFYLRNASKQ
jgi:hypothetical protein